MIDGAILSESTIKEHEKIKDLLQLAAEKIPRCRGDPCLHLDKVIQIT